MEVPIPALIFKLIRTFQIDLHNHAPRLWAFQLTLDPTKPLDDMGYMNGNARPCAIEFKTRLPEMELGRIMEDSSEGYVRNRSPDAISF